MAKTYTGSGMRVELSKTLGAAVTVSAVTKANPAVATLATGHGMQTGDVVRFDVPEGMVQLDRQAVRVTITGDSATLEGLDTTGYSDFTAGSVREVTAWDAADNLTGWTLNEGTPNRTDVTTIHDTEIRQDFGLDAPLEGTMPMLSNPNSAFVKNLRAASKSHADVVQRVTHPGGLVIVLNSTVSGGRGIGFAPNQRSEASASFSTVREVMFYE